jgi:uncharacterized membrane protein YgaE (UPF0421/DUF939 family)
MNDVLKQGCAVLKTVLNYLDKWQLVRPLELAILTVLCFMIGRFAGYVIGWGSSYFSGFWVILVALLVTKDAEIKLSDLQSRLMAIGLGLVAGFIVLSAFGIHFISLFISVILVAWACTFFNWHHYQQMAILALIVFVLAGYIRQDLEIIHDISLWLGALGKLIEAAIGMLLAYGTHCFFTCLKDCKHKSLD